VLELAQSLGLDLTDALAGDLELLADFLQGVLVPAAQAEAHLEDLRFALGQAFEGLLDLLAQIDMDDGVGRGDHDLVLDEVAAKELPTAIERSRKNKDDD